MITIFVRLLKINCYRVEGWGGGGVGKGGGGAEDKECFFHGSNPLANVFESIS